MPRRLASSASAIMTSFTNSPANSWVALCQVPSSPTERNTTSPLGSSIHSNDSRGPTVEDWRQRVGRAHAAETYHPFSAERHHAWPHMPNRELFIGLGAEGWSVRPQIAAAGAETNAFRPRSKMATTEPSSGILGLPLAGHRQSG